MVVKFISSTSIAGELINGKGLKVGDKVIAKAETGSNTKDEESTQVKKDSSKEVKIVQDNKIQNRKDTRNKDNFSGRISVQSYSNISNLGSRDEYQRWRYTINLKAQDISGTGLSLSTYTNLVYRADEWNTISSNIGRNLKIYDLSVNYKFNEKSIIWLGRHLNREISNIGSIDGVQFESGIGQSNYIAGVIAGSRPDFADLGFNSKLFELGGYIVRQDSAADGIIKSTLAFFEQTNNLKTDRRFLYLQHSNNLIPNTNLFLSSEIDLYKKILETQETKFTLTSLFLSARISPVKLFSFSLSYDARKNVIYYETFKNFIDSLFENETRQGLSARINIRPFNSLFLSLNGGYRFRGGDIKPSRNFGGSITYSQIPFLLTTANISYSRLISNFVDGAVYGARFSKTIFSNSTDISIGYRRSDYKFGEFSKTHQNSFSADLSNRITNFLYLSISYEGIFERKRTSGRVLMDLTARF
jgi:hypothetical protein